MTSSTSKSKRRLVFMFFLVCLFSILLTFRVGWIQIVRADHYASLAKTQQTKDTSLTAQRGVIYDRNMNELAISAEAYIVYVRPAEMYGNSETEDAKAVKLEKTARVLAEILELDKDTVKELLGQDRATIRIARNVEKEKVTQIRAAMRDNEIQLTGIVIDPASRRYYPQGAFMAHVLGSVNDDSEGLSGIELQYEQYLSGTPGRWIKSSDSRTNSLSYGTEKYYDAEDGLGVVLTIDEMTQYYVEQAIAQVAEDTQALRVYCMAMDPKTGEILAMASTPNFDPNNPKVPLDEEEAARVAEMTPEEQMNYWNSQMWRNPLISDTYDPGSTFKLLTTAIALEERVTYVEDPTFYCSGSVTLYNQRLNCWSKNPHGAQTLVQAVGNSCNPAFVELGSRIGLSTFFDYIERLGLDTRTGVDYPGEARNILQKRETAGPVGLATMSYGHGISVTPISLLSAISTLGNNGMLMEPHLVKAFVDGDGNVVQSFEPKEVRQVFSQQTVEEMAYIMEEVVYDFGGQNAKVTGYRIGGKTGTALKPENGGYSRTRSWSSFVGMAPMDDPQIAILLVVDEPGGGTLYGSQTAAPGVKMIFEKVLLHMGIQPEYSAAEQADIDKQLTTVPNVVGLSYWDAANAILNQSLNYVVSPALPESEEPVDFTVVDQYPKAGEKKNAGDAVYIYWM